MPQDIEGLMADDSFTEEEKKEIRDRVAAPDEAAPPPEPTPDEEETPPIVPVEEEEDEEPDEAAAPPEAATKPKPKWLERVDKEKRKREEAERELAALREKWTAGEKRLADLAARVEQAPAEPEKPSIPDPQTDAFGHLAGRLGIAESTLGNVIKHFEEQQSYFETQKKRDAEFTRWRGEFETYEKDVPDIRAAITDLAQKRRQELTIVGMDPSQIAAHLDQEELGIVQYAHEHGKNPAEMFYELAKLRGYSPTPTAKPNGNGNGAADLERIADGQRKAASTPPSSDSEVKGLTLEKVLAMSDEDYEKLVAKFGSFNKLTAKLSA